ncbi:TM2 domain-domain-containing protein [Lobosporangium transversale]|uniref:TM2 domain-domain-containing protein n=1 Tax=Lobosporangium transversale TaxID=64571 RepID=A0A1Y2GX41_9FUNG|nr:TM2 domain-domain-containing protein [Lobosporangium transversale]ORZ26384.1 TM2 domain-domain-containing protein [Lobosporangium transversale]|eukprot:XP_021884149.1 TM2 domain-domain-containing protein [Lobosporangium transversale]
MSNPTYGATNHQQIRRDEESQVLLNGVPVSVTETNDTFYGRTFRHVHHHRKRYFFLWLLAAISAISIVLGLYYFQKNRHEGDKSPAPGDGNFLGKKGDDVCQSDRSYPIAILLSIFFGYIGVDRFYLGYIITALLKLITAGGLGIWYIIDIVLIIVGGLPDHNGCTLIP